MAEAEVARRLSLSSLFFSFGYMEGFSLPPAEAMASENVVVGYSGFGGREYFKEEFCYPVANSDIKTFVHSAERALDESRKNPSAFKARQGLARSYIETHYTREKELRSIERAWQNLLS